jgi:hypothetical protein
VGERHVGHGLDPAQLFNMRYVALIARRRHGL